MTEQILDIASHWLGDGRSVALATVVGTWGSSPCPTGSQMLVAESGQFAGSVSGGCVESAVIEAALKVLASGTPALLEFGVSDERAWEVGLACGGQVRIYVQALAGATGMRLELLQSIRAAQQAGRAVALLTWIADGRQQLLALDVLEWPEFSAVHSAAVRSAAMSNQSSLMESESGDIFIHILNPPLRMIIIGAVHIGQYLAVQAQACGYEVIIVDPRKTFAAAERFPGLRVVTDWPDQAMAALRPDSRTAVIALSHDPKLDDPALASALQSEAFYIGALGSRRNQAARKARLCEAGFNTAQCDRIHGPVGLDIHAQSPAEIAVAIMAEVIAVARRPK